MKTASNTNLILSNSFAGRSCNDLIHYTLIIMFVCTLSACTVGHPPRLSDLRVADPSARLAAIQLAAQTDDRATIPGLIANLDSDDAAVRLMAIGTLSKFTGRSYNYRFDAPPEERDKAVATWVEAWEKETIPHAQPGAPQP